MKTISLIAAFCLLASPLVGADQPQASTDAQPRARKVETAPVFTPAKANPLIGDWQGSGGMVAQVYLTPAGNYQANLLRAFDVEDNLIAVLKGTESNDAVAFTGDGWAGSIQQSHFTGSKGGESFDLQHVDRVSPTLGATPAAGAVVLFDGHNFDAWAKKSGKEWLTEDGPPKWKLTEDGAMSIVPGTDCIITHQKFGDCHLHVEFRTLGTPSKSAAFLETRYEVNINETYGRVDGNMTGGLDNSTDKTPPKIRAALPPLAWQTFDIDFRAPRFDSSGKKTESANMTVVLNGVKIYDHQKLALPHGAAGRLGEAPTGPIMLQDHLTPLEYRNIWVLEAGH